MPRLLLLLAFVIPLAAAELPRPKIRRIYPLGGRQGTSVQTEILGSYLSNARRVEFDCRDLVWTQTTHASSGKLSGTLSIARNAPLGPHWFRVWTEEGYSTSAIFNVGQFPDVLENEPNDRVAEAQPISRFPVEVQGFLDGAPDIDVFRIQSRAGERWTIDLRSLDRGSSLEAKMFLLDGKGERLVFNDDRDDFDESPFIEHTFEKDGTYYIKLDQYRGPRGFRFSKDSAYVLRISGLPNLQSATPLGAAVGSTTTIKLVGTGLGPVEEVYLTEIRAAEQIRMTYPYTKPIHFRPDPSTAEQLGRLEGRVVRAAPSFVEARFTIPAQTRPGLWRLWASSPQGTVEGPSIEMSEGEEYGEAEADQADWRRGGYAINGELEKPREKDIYRIEGVAGRPLHFWTLAAQLGLPYLDTVLTLRDAGGKQLAENDDVVAGHGALIGNPDSSLFYTPAEDGPLWLEVKDRLVRGGPSYPYRLKVRSERPGFQTFTTPQNFTVSRGGWAEIKVHMAREEGFDGAVSVWFEDLPPGVEPPRGAFRSDQRFEPGADGAAMIIPEIAFRIQAPASLPAGTYPIRVLSVPTAELSSSTRRLVEAHTTITMGPLLDLWNFVRRPLPQITMTVVEPFEARLSAETQTLSLSRGGSATLALTAENCPQSANIVAKGLPSGVAFKLAGREGDESKIQLDADEDAPLGSYEFSVEAQVGNRWAPTQPIILTVEPSSKRVAEKR